MKQITQTQRGGRLEVKDVPAPSLRPEGVLVRTAFSVISAGTERAKVDVAKKGLIGKALARPDQVRQVIQSVRQVGIVNTYQKVASRLHALDPLGYSSAGVVLAVGALADGFAPGDRVACAGAGYANHAEIVYVPKNLCARVPAGVDLEQAAFATLGAIALQGVRQAQPTLGETVGVIGLGLVGLLTVQLLRANGCRVVGLDINRGRCDLARQLGAEVATTPDDPALDALIRASAPAALDAVILTAATKSSRPIELAGSLARDHARVVVVGDVGLEVPRAPFYAKELEIRLSRSYGPGRYDPQYEEKGIDYPIGYVRWTEARNLESFLRLIAERKVDLDPLITHRFSITEAEKAYALISGEVQEPYLGVLLDYGQSPAAAPLTDAIQVKSASPVPGKLGLALLGAGNFAQSVLLPHLNRHADVRLRTVVTPGGLTARSVAERHGFESCAADPAPALADPDTRLVMIASRHDSHADLAERALRAGKAVFVEKPLALNAEQLQRICAAYAAAPGAFLMVGFNRRFAPAVCTVRAFFTNAHEPLLMQYRVNAGYIPREHWIQDPEIGGGRIVGEVCHFVDALLYVAGHPVVEVAAHALPDSGRYSRDNLTVTLRFADGSVGTVVYAANGPPGLEKERLEVLGGGAAAVLDNFRRVTLYRGDRPTVHKSAPDKGHRSEMMQLIDAVKSARPEPVPFADAVHVTEITFAIVQALATGAPVQVTPR